MSGITDILNKTHPLPVRELSNWFREQHANILMTNPNTKSFFDRIFSEFSKIPDRFTEKEWDRLRLLAYIFTIAYDPPSDYISFQFPTNSKNGFLVAASFVLLSMRQKSPESIDIMYNFFKDRINSFFPREQRSSFYEISPCYYFQSIPHILEGQIYKTPFINELPLIYKKIIAIEPQQLTYSMVTFVAEVYKIVKDAIMSNQKIPLPEDFVLSFLHILDLSSEAPTLFLGSFFHTWFFLVNKGKDLPRAHQLCERISTITVLFEKTAMYKYHELHRNFPWYLLFHFYDYIPPDDHIQKVRILSFICNGIRRVNFPRIPDSVKKFSHSIEQQYSTQNPFYIFYMFSSLDSSLRALIYQLRKLHAVDKIVPNAPERIKKRQISFLEQANWNPNSPEIDSYLHSLTYEKCYSSVNSCAKDFERISRICENIKQCSHSLVMFQIQISIVMRKIISKEAQPNPAFDLTNPFYYLIKTFTSFFDFMVFSSYKQMEIISFSNREVLTNAEMSPQCSQWIQNPQRLLDYNLVFQKYFEVLDKFPPAFLNTLALSITDDLFVFMSKRILSYNFIYNLTTITRNSKCANNLLSLIVTRMMELASIKIKLLMSADINDANLYYSWVVFTIRLATLPNGGPNYLFGCTLKIYQRMLLMSVFSNLKSIPHQSIAIRLINHYLKALKANYKVNDDPKDKIKPFRIRPIALEEIECTAFVDTLNIIMEVILTEPEFMGEHSLIPILDAAFKTNDLPTINKAAKICLRIFTPERSTQNHITPRPELEDTVFKALVNSINIIDLETATEVANILPYYSAKFLRKVPLKTPRPADTFVVGKIDIYKVLKAASERLLNSEEEATHLFALTDVCFELVISEVLVSQKILQPTLTLLINILKHLYGFTHLRDPMDRLITSITSQFGDLFLRGESNTYLLCLFDIMGINRSDSTAVVMKFGVSFFEYCKGKPHNPIFVSNTIDKLFSFFPNSTRLFSILGGFSLFIRYYPQFITLNHIRNFLIQTQDIYPLDKAFSSMLNMFLKRFLAKSDRQTQRKFVSMIYEIICPLSISVRNVIEKRLSKLEIPLQIKSLEVILKTTEIIHQFQQLTLAFLCGIEGNLQACLNQDWINRVNQFFKPSDNIHRLQKYARLLSLCLSILKNTIVFKYFSANTEFFNNLIRFLCNTMMSHFEPVQHAAKKCFKILRNVYYSDLMCVKQIDEFWRNPTKMFSFWGPQPDRIGFYTRLTKILPEKTPPEIINDFFVEIGNYIEKSDIEKMTYLIHFSKILKQFSAKPFIQLEPVKNIILSNSNGNASMLEMYIEYILTLYRSTTIPFKSVIKKQVLKFLVMFPQQTVNYLINVCNDSTLFNYILLEELIIEDQTNTFFQNFLMLFKATHNFAMLSPALYAVFEKITLIEKFAREQELLNVLQREFTQVIHSCTDPSKKDENGLAILASLAISFMNTMKYHIELKQAINVAAIFRLSFFNNSDVYQKYIRTVFQNKSQMQVLIDILKGSVKSLKKLPPNMALILVPHSIKSIDNIPQPTAITIWNQLIDSLQYIEQNATVIKSMVYMLDKAEPKREQLALILNGMKHYLTSTDTQIVIFSLKLCTKLANMNLLPQQIYESIIQQMFSFSKFFDAPYANSFINLIKSRPDFLESLSPRVIEIISSFFYDKFLTSLRELQKAIQTISNVPQIFKLLPFSFFAAFSKSILKKISHITKIQEELAEIKEYLKSAITLYHQLSPSSNERKGFIIAGFKYISIVMETQNTPLNQTNNIKDFNEAFFNIIIDVEIENYPVKLLNKLDGKVNSSTAFFIICSASHFIPNQLFKDFPNCIESALKFISDDKNNISNTMLSSFMKFVCDPLKPLSRQIFGKFQNSIRYLVTLLTNNVSPVTFDRIVIISNAVVSSHFDAQFGKHDIIKGLWNAFLSMESSTLSNTMFKMLLRFSESIPIEDQVDYVDFIIKRTCWNASTMRTLTLTLPSLMSCTTLVNEAKKQLISIFPTHIRGTSSEILKIIKSVKEFGESSKLCMKGTLITLYLLIASNSTPATRFMCIEKIDEILGIHNFKVKLHKLIIMLPMEMWSDQYYIYIISVLSERDKLWHTLTALAPKLSGIASIIAFPLFVSKIEDDVIIDSRQFLIRLLQDEWKGKCAQVIITIEQTLMNTIHNLKFSLYSRMFNVAPEAMSTSNTPGFFKFDKYNMSHLIYSDPFNDSMINEIISSFDYRTKTAIYLTHLGKYEAAEMLYQIGSKPENEYYEKVRLLNRRFLPRKEIDFDTIIQPLLKVDNAHVNVTSDIRDAVDAYLTGNTKSAMDSIRNVKDYLIRSYKPNRSPVVFRKERLTVLSIIAFMIENRVNNSQDENIPLIRYKRKSPEISCLNPSGANMILNFQRLLDKRHPKNDIIIDTSSPPAILISPSIYHKFKKVTGISPYGLFALNSEQIEELFNNAAEKLTSPKGFTIANWIAFAPFCFNIFIAQQTRECFSSAFGAYCHIVASKDENTQHVQRAEASARLVTLIRIAAKQYMEDSRDSFKDPIVASSFIFKRGYAEVWRIWLQQLVDLANHKWFFSIASELFTEMAYRSTLYASKYASKDVQDAIRNAIVNEVSFGQISMMNMIETILGKLDNSTILGEVEHQTKINKFIEESIRLSDDDVNNITDLIVLRHKKFCLTPFEAALSHLTKREINRIGDFKEWVNTMKQNSLEEREKFIQELTNSSTPLSKIYQDISDIVDDFNEQMPFVFPIRGDVPCEFLIFVMHKDFTVLSPELILFTATTSFASNDHFLLMRTNNPNGFHASVMSLSNLFTLLRTILRNEYPTMMRSITLAENASFEIGASTMLKNLDSEPISLKQLFEREMMITQEEWIDECIDKETGKLNQAGEESIQYFSPDVLANRLKQTVLFDKSNIPLHPGITSSYASASLVRYMLSAPYNDMNRVIACGFSLEIPVLAIDFDTGNFIDETPWSTFRFSPCIENICGVWGNSGLKMAIASTASAFTANLEIIRTHLEVILGDEMLTEDFSLNEIIRQRRILEDRFISLSPPNSGNVNEEEATGWLERIENLVEKAKNPWIQPAITIPWF
ncbi:hypothetical protein TRFO_00836 [Tritrichomonas foetus]|uniref:Uncharacterized protein n=1 Tax=Tritrichomonas foetus TaxID=1144522 RepID=A0A1J4L247_9EUKA|nr:hypothetical protein TRFO_00836 [Tritrichomonas foetus]|eukprot:OHT17585.1 hypothetical protein TRFO_00836 [Tritrichomonas foetus]